MKHINFLCGLQRSGSTLLLNLLNQHPEVYASPDSALLDGLSAMRNTFIHSESVRFGLRTSAYQETLWTVPQLFYKDIKKDIIFDKQFCWSTPENYELATKISFYPRFILCYRPILEVLASFVFTSSNNPKFIINKYLDESNFYPKHYLNRNDCMAEYLMTEHGSISKCILGLSFAKQNEKLGNFKFVAYDNLVTDPQKVMNDIFDFLKLEPIEIQKENLHNTFLYLDSEVLGVKDFHSIRPSIKKTSPKPEDLFSDFILEKYKNALAPIGL
jgi:hypothetical protein